MLLQETYLSFDGVEDAVVDNGLKLRRKHGRCCIYEAAKGSVLRQGFEAGVQDTVPWIVRYRVPMENDMDRQLCVFQRRRCFR